MKRFGPHYVDADEVQDPNPEPVSQRATELATEKEAATELANRLADEWSVNGARVLVAELGIEFLREFLAFMNECRERGELGHIRNPGGMFVKKAYRTYDRHREERQARHGHPSPGNGPWNQFTD